MPDSRKGLKPDYEHEIFKKGFGRVIGIDEVGRGAWAGPLVLAAYALTQEGDILEGVNDSKKLSKKKRGELAKNLTSNSTLIEVEAERVDEMGVGSATEWAISELIKKLNASGTYFLIDGRFPSLKFENTEIIVDGDAKIYSIACASVVAKVHRDDIMSGFSAKFPGYYFEKHVGYGTKVHIEAIKKLGITTLHRKSYKPIRIISSS